MLDKIKLLEEKARQLQVSPNQRNEWQQAVVQNCHRFLDDLENSKTYFYDSVETSKDILSLEIGQSKRMETLLGALTENVEQSGINAASGKHLGYIPGGGLFASGLADFYAAIMNTYTGLFYGNPGAVRIENQLLRWMCDLIGYPKTALGNLTSGGSIANLIAITTARDVKEIKGAKIAQSVVYLSQQVHHCVQKALRIAGLADLKIRYISLDEGYRMCADALSEQLQKDQSAGLHPFMVVASAGTTDTGAIDPLDKIADLAAQHNFWFHIDAAYGGFFILVDAMKAQFKGVERSDSLAIDPHKGLFLPYGTGAVLMKNMQAMFDSHFYKANYMQDAQAGFDEFSPADLSPELTRHFRSLRMWLPLQLHGVEPFKAALEEKAALCRYFYQKVQELGFEVGPPPELSVMIFRYVPDGADANDFNKKMVDTILREGDVFISTTTIDGIYWIRLAVLSFRTHLREIDLLLNRLGAYLGNP